MAYPRVVRLWEAFLLQMNDFDRFLETQLRQMLDPVTETPAPPFKAHRVRRPRTPLLTVVTVPIELVAAEAAAIGEPAVVPVPVEPSGIFS